MKAPVSNTGLRVVDSTSAAEVASASATATATALAKGRITIMLPKAIADQQHEDVNRLMASIEALVKEYDFIGGVEMEVTA